MVPAGSPLPLLTLVMRWSAGLYRRTASWRNSLCSAASGSGGPRRRSQDSAVGGSLPCAITTCGRATHSCSHLLSVSAG